MVYFNREMPGTVDFIAASDLHDVTGIALKRHIFRRVVSAEVGTPGSDMIEKDRAKIRLEGRRHEAPHVLIATETMSEDHDAGAVTHFTNIVSFKDRHATLSLADRAFASKAPSVFA